MMICRQYTMLNKHEQSPSRPRIVSRVPAPSSVMSHSSSASPPFRSLFSQSPSLTFPSGQTR